MPDLLRPSCLRLAAFCLGPLLAWPAAAEEPLPIVRGTQGLIEVPFTADNKGPGGIACSAALAHWYSLDLGQASPGASVRGTLWYDPKDGSMLLLNALKDHMPIQALWCGIAARAWTTRAEIALARKTGTAPPPIHVACRPEGEGLSCR